MINFPYLTLAQWQINEKIEKKLLLSNVKNANDHANVGFEKLYSSTYKLQHFFEQEYGKYKTFNKRPIILKANINMSSNKYKIFLFIAYVKDIEVIIKKNINLKDEIKLLEAYVSSFYDVIGHQDITSPTFMYNPINVYSLVRHVIVGRPKIEKVFAVSNILNRKCIIAKMFLYKRDLKLNIIMITFVFLIGP